MSTSDSNGSRQDIGPTPEIGLYLDGDGCWPDLAVLPYTTVSRFEMAVVPKGTITDRPIISFRFEDDDGRIIIGQTSLRLLAKIMEVITEKYGEE